MKLVAFIDTTSGIFLQTTSVTVVLGGCANGTCVRNTIEFQNRELNTGSFPKGLALLFAANNNWNYDKDGTSGQFDWIDPNPGSKTFFLLKNHPESKASACVSCFFLGVWKYFRSEASRPLSPPPVFLFRSLDAISLKQDPFEALKFEAPLEELKARLEKGEPVPWR